MRRLLPAMLILLAGSAPGLLADEGRIPVYQPTTLTQPGHYVLTRNISVTSGDVITINARDLTLDLNGHTISSSAATGSLIEILDGSDNVRIRRGNLQGGSVAIHAFSTAGVSLFLENVHVANSSGTGILIIGAKQVEVSASTVRGTGQHAISVDPAADGTGFSGRFVNNAIDGAGNRGLIVPGLRNGEVRGNLISNCVAQGLQDGASGTAGGNTIEGNTFLSNGGGIQLSSPHNLVLNNVIKGSTGIGIILDALSPTVGAHENRVAGNVVSGNMSTAPCGSGVCVQGARNLIEGNLVEGNSGTGCGIHFFGTISLNNAYRNNMLRGNITGVCLTSAFPQTDAGGNIL